MSEKAEAQKLLTFMGLKYFLLCTCFVCLVCKSSKRAVFFLSHHYSLLARTSCKLQHPALLSKHVSRNVCNVILKLLYFSCNNWLLMDCCHLLPDDRKEPAVTVKCFINLSVHAARNKHIPLEKSIISVCTSENTFL